MLEAVEAPVEQPRDVAVAERLVGRPEHDRVQLHPAALGARRQVPARLVGVTGLDAVQAGVGGQQRVARREVRVPRDRHDPPPRERAEDRRGHVQARQHRARRAPRSALPARPGRAACGRRCRAGRAPRASAFMSRTKRATGSLGTGRWSSRAALAAAACAAGCSIVACASTTAASLAECTISAASSALTRLALAELRAARLDSPTATASAPGHRDRRRGARSAARGAPS